MVRDAKFCDIKHLPQISLLFPSKGTFGHTHDEQILELDLLPHGCIQDKKHVCLIHDLAFALGFK